MHTFTFTHTHTHTHKQTHTHTQTHTHIQTHTHTGKTSECLTSQYQSWFWRALPCEHVHPALLSRPISGWSILNDIILHASSTCNSLAAHLPLAMAFLPILCFVNNNLMCRMCDASGIIGPQWHTSRSLQVTAATSPHKKNIPEKLIQEHRGIAA